MKNKFPIKRTLGPISAKFLNELLGCGKIIFTLDDAANVYGKNKHASSKFLSDLIKRGIIFRIKAGIYLILLMGQENIQTSNWPIIARELADPLPYFISHYSAMRLHGMTTHSLFEISITTTKRRRTKKINNITYHFIFSKQANFWGSEVRWISKQDKIMMSDLERTILDGLERPDLCGGIKEVIRGIWIKHKEINWNKLVSYADQFHTKAAVKRLGFILELFELGTEYLPLLKNSIAHAKDYNLLDPYGSKEGKYSNSWFIKINLNLEELKAGVWE